MKTGFAIANRSTRPVKGSVACVRAAGMLWLLADVIAPRTTSGSTGGIDGELHSGEGIA